MLNFKQIAQMLAQRAEEVARYLFPHGCKKGMEWRIGNIQGEEGESLGVHLIGPKAGVWFDFAEGIGGDLLDLWSVKRNISLVEALKEASTYLGVTHIKLERLRGTNFVKPAPKKILLPLAPSSAVQNYLVNERKLTLETIQAFQVGELNGKIIFPYFRDGELILIKYLNLDRPNGKKQISVEKNCEPCLFGWQLIPSKARKITLCEGELDAMSLYQYGIPALSVPFGGGRGEKQKWLQYEYDRLSVYEEINLCLDADIEGKAAVSELIERLGCYRCRIVELPYKDPNACLQAGVLESEMIELFNDAKTLDPQELKRADSFVDQVINEFYPGPNIRQGYDPPWEKAKGKILFRPDELSVWTGINGHGKSQILGQVILSTIQQGGSVCIASLELKPKRLLARLTRQASGIANPSVEYVHSILSWYGDRLWLFDLVGNAKSKRLIEVFLYARMRYGVDVFVIDSFMKLDIAEDDYKSQKAFIEQLCDFKNQYNCHIHIVVHPKKREDEMQILSKLDVKGTGAITDLADNCFNVWRNKKKEELLYLMSSGRLIESFDTKQQKKLAECDSLWTCDKQRNGEWEGKIGLWFHKPSFQYLNHETQQPLQYVNYSNSNLEEVYNG